MLIADLSVAALRERLRGEGLRFELHPFTVALRTSLGGVATAVARMYADFPLAAADFADFHIGVGPPGGPRRWLRPQAVFGSITARLSRPRSRACRSMASMAQVSVSERRNT